MKNWIKIAAVGFFAFVFWPRPAQATYTLLRDASLLIRGILPNARLDPSSVTLQGNYFTLGPTSLTFPDGSAQTTAAGSSQWATNGTHIYHTNTGNVGIGTQNPTGRLDVRGPFVTTGTVNLAGANGNVGIGTLATGTSLVDVVGGSVTIRGTNAGLSVAGNTGIGTTQPSSLLDVSGGSLTIRGANAGLSVAGNTGIGTTQPSSILDISGGSLTIRGSNAGLSVAGSGSFVSAAGTVGPLFVISSGTTRLFEVNGASVVANVQLTRPLPPISEIAVITANGYGAVSTKIRRWATIAKSSGTDITYTDDANAGASFTTNVTGLYTVAYCDEFSGAVHMGLSLNSQQPTTNIDTINAGNRIISMATPAANLGTCVSVTKAFVAGDVIRAHTTGQGSGTNTTNESFTITRIGQ